MPENGKHGSAQLDRPSGTSITDTISRPVCSGSTLLSTVPRYLPKYCLRSASGMTSSPLSGHRDAVGEGPEGVASEREALDERSRLHRRGDAADAPVAVIELSGTAHGDELTGAQEPPIAHGVERPGSGDHIARLHRSGDGARRSLDRAALRRRVVAARPL